MIAHAAPLKNFLKNSYGSTAQPRATVFCHLSLLESGSNREQHRLAFDLRAVAQQVEYGRPIDGTVFDEHACRLGAQGICCSAIGSPSASPMSAVPAASSRPFSSGSNSPPTRGRA